MFGSLKSAVNDGGRTVGNIAGWGDTKVQRFRTAVSAPFIVKRRNTSTRAGRRTNQEAPSKRLKVYQSPDDKPETSSSTNLEKRKQPVSNLTTVPEANTLDGQATEITELPSTAIDNTASISGDKPMPFAGVMAELAKLRQK